MFNQIDGNISVQTLYSGYQSTSIVFSEALFLVQGASIPPLPKSLLSPFTSLLCSLPLLPLLLLQLIQQLHLIFVRGLHQRTQIVHLGLTLHDILQKTSLTYDWGNGKHSSIKASYCSLSRRQLGTVLIKSASHSSRSHLK